MKFSTRTDVEAPQAFVFEQLSDFRRFEQQAERRGAEVTRTRDAQGAGTAWKGAFDLRGHRRRIEMEIAEHVAPELIVARGRVEGVQTELRVELVPLSAKSTRVLVSLDLRPSTLTARLLVQSLKLAKGKLDRRFDERVAKYGADIAGRYAVTA